MPCDANFGIIDDFDEQNNYTSFFNFKDMLREHHCVPIDDEILNDWVEAFENVKTYYHCFSRPDKGFARYGVTLVPPESIAALIGIVETKTSAQWREGFNIDKLLELLKKANAAKKFVIVYGV
ncbi:hypothetical protein [Treponema endosymbiont of Eucomonympha sp.]|uniref:hypothetical protein n=1 Tax=Treponema endosymbiont of Eucomonympha sp. TaxID=1580831 RepID=UPI000784B6CD|nr:hypothetical protein [Treponema endosymbiont of Eucomonympha sp.]